MAFTQLYDGAISGAALTTALGDISAANLLTIVSSNGQQVLVLRDS